MGYYNAGFDVIGVDLADQPRYPFEFIQEDALSVLSELADPNYHGWLQWIGTNLKIDAIHASPPCQAFSILQKQNKREYPDLIGPTRELLEQTGLPYVIENVPAAPLREPTMLCGTMFPGLRVIRHRMFETNFELEALKHPAKHPLVYTRDKRKRHYGKCDENTCFVQVTGGGNSSVAAARDAMGIPWMTKKELNEAIPPAYTEYVGGYLMKEVHARR